MGGSSSKSSSKPKDMTPKEFKALRQPFADVLSSMIGEYDPAKVDELLNGYKGPTTAGGPTSNEQTLLNQLMQTTGGVNGSGQTGSTPAGGQNAQDLLNSTMLSGQSPEALKQFTDALGIGGGPQSSLADFMSQLNGASGTGAFSGDPNNPLMQDYIKTAQRQTQQALEETLGRTLPGRFAMAGQRTQPGSSSAFDRAAAIATRGTADALGDIATKISYNAFEAAQGREAEALGSELSRRGSKDLQTQQLTSQAQQAQADRSLEASKQSTANELAGAQIQQQEVDTMIKNLQAQALPRLIEEMGIERGMEVFNTRVNTLLAGLGISAGVTAPTVGNESKSSSMGVQLK